MKQRVYTVGITAVGSGIGQAVLNALRLSGLGLKIIGLEASAFSKGLYECDVGYHLPHATSPHYAPVLLQHCQNAGINLLIPGSDTELVPLAQLAPELLLAGTQVVVGAAACVQLCRDKWKLAHYLRSLGLAFVETWSLTETLDSRDERPYPLIVKRSDGSGSVDVQVIYAPADWSKLQNVDDPEEWIVQPFLMSCKWQGAQREEILHRLRASGYPPQVEELSMQFFVSDWGQIVGRFASINSLKRGVPVQIDPVDTAAIWRPAEQIVESLIALGLRGPVNLQGRITPEGPCFFEINPRFTGITHVRALMGYREVEAAVHHVGFGESGASVQALLDHNAAKRYIGLRQTAESVAPRAVVNQFQQEGKLPAREHRFRRILITGLTGYLGRALADALLSRGGVDEIVAPVRHYSQAKGVFDDTLNARIRFVEWSDPEWMQPELLHQVDMIVHTAAARTGADASDWHRFNVLGTAALVAAARTAAVPRVIFVSSQSVYDTRQPRPWSETGSVVCPATPYAHSKAGAEGIVQTLTGSETRWLILRLSRLYGLGAGMRWHELPHRFLTLAQSGEPLVIHGDGNQEMDLLYITDAVDCMIQLADAPITAWNQLYNVGSGAPVSVSALARTCIEVVEHRNGPISPIQYVADTQPLPSFGMSIEHIRAATGWSPCISLRCGLEQILEYLVSSK